MRWPARPLLLLLLCATPAGGCSAPPEMMPRPPGPTDVAAAPPEPPDATPQAACVQEAEEGAEPEEGAPDAPVGCCPGVGLTRVPVYRSSFLRVDECQLVGGGRFSCIQCGNGRCGKGENVCNCPADCH